MKRNRMKVNFVLSALAFLCLTALFCTDLRFFSNVDWAVFWTAYVGVAVSSVAFGTALFRTRLNMVASQG